MPMVVPHQSQVGIATAGGGGSTPFRSVSSFLTPGAAEQAQGLRDLAHGIDIAGNALEKVSLERQRMQTATDMLASKVETEESLRGFDSNYRQTHQGVSARDAEQAYGQFLQGEYDKLQKRYGGNPYHMEAASRMFEGIRQPALARAVAYRDNEEEGYKKTLLESSRAQTLQKFADPSMPWQEKEAALREEENNLRLFAGQTFDPKSGQWTGGKDVTAQSMALRQKMESEHLNGLVSSGQLDAARAFLGMSGASGGTSTSASNLAANNFGNVKNGNGGYNAYASRQDGLMGVGERVLRYNNAPERGWHAQTLREFSGIYAPFGDGKNNPDKYSADLGKMMGVDPNQKIDFRDPKILAGLIRFVPILEHGAQRVSVSEDEAMQAAQALLAGKKPNLAGVAGGAPSGDAPSGGGPMATNLPAEDRRKYMLRIEEGMTLRFVGAFAKTPLEGIAEISTPEGMAKYGMDAKTAISARSMLQSQWSFNKSVEKQRHDTYITDTVNGIYTTLMGDPNKGIAPDPAKAYQVLQNSNLDAITKIEMGKKLEEGTIGKTRDPAAVNDMARQIVNGSIDSDAPIDVMLAQGKASVGDVSMLKGMRKDMDGPLKDYLKRADNLIKNAYARSQFAAGTPEAAIKEDRARSQLSSVITEAYRKGGPEAVEKLFNSDTPMSIMNSNAITVDDALSSVNRLIGAGGAESNKKPTESAQDFVKRRTQGAAQ